jgi:hypothetical protein
MKKFSRSLVFALIISLVMATVAHAMFTNGSFETGDFTGWTVTTFNNQGINQPPGPGGSNLSDVVGGPSVAPMSLSDPNTGGNVKYPAVGNYSARVNNELSYDEGGHPRDGNTISQTISAVLDPSDGLMHVRFTFAAVMVAPADDDHEIDELPYFRVKAVNTSNGGDVLFDFYSHVGEPGKNWLEGIPFDNGDPDDEGDRWQYIDWTSADLASSAAHPVNAGDVITLYITAAGCALGGHPGYVYVDDINDGGDTGTGANLTLAASGASTVKPGDQYTYTLSYTTDADVSDAQVSLTLPGHTTFVSSDESCTAASGVVTCDLGALSAGSGSFNITLLVDKLKKVGTSLTLPTASYSMSATNATTVNGSTEVSADVLTPFADVPEGHWALDYIQSIWAAGITTGCSASPLMYCPDNYVNRGEAAVMIERGMGNFSPSPNPSGMFADVPYPGLEAYTPFIEEFYNDGITDGCSLSPLMYCPQDNITRGETAVFIERALGNFSPSPSPSGMFADVPYPGLEAYTPFIEEFYNDGISVGCSVNPLMYCPQYNVIRSEIAVFLQRAFNLPLPS